MAEKKSKKTPTKTQQTEGLAKKDRQIARLRARVKAQAREINALGAEVDRLRLALTEAQRPFRVAVLEEEKAAQEEPKPIRKAVTSISEVQES